MEDDTSGDRFGQGGLNDHVDPDSLLQDIGLDREEIEWRKDFIGFDQDDANRLEAYSDVFEEHSDTVADRFYENLTLYDQTRAILERSPKGVEELKETQKAYLESLADGTYDRAFVRNRARIGALHDVLDMPMKQYIGQYGVYYDVLLQLVTREIQQQVDRKIDSLDERAADGGVQASRDTAPRPFTKENVKAVVAESVDSGVADFHSMLKRLNLDMQIVADTYLQSYTQDIEATVQEQQSVAGEVRRSVGELTTASEAVASKASEISEVANRQAEGMDEVAGEVSNLSATIEEVASSATQVEDQSELTKDLARDGQESANGATNQMEQLEGAKMVISNRVDQLETKVEEIETVVSVINEIADQTNLLALNANIEAARAGEAGDGFAVVADEVKSLAEDTQEHAESIESMIEDVKSAATETAQTLDTVEEGIEKGNESVQETTQLLEKIVDAVDETVSGVSEIADATDDQAASAEEIAAMVDETRDQAKSVADMIEDIAASTEEQSASISQIEEAAEQLQSGP